MKNIKRLISVFVTTIVSLSICFSLAACNMNTTREPEYEDREVGDFVVRFYDDYCEIKGTTEQGNNQEFLIVPKYIEGLEVRSWGAYNPFHDFNMSNTEYYTVYITSENLKKVYFEKLKNYYPNVTSGSCPNLERVLYLDFFSVPWGFGGRLYFPQKRYETLKGYPIFEINANPANVSYYYNYENPKNGGYYWIDDCAYGSKIEFTPPEPTREGYTFGGWYKEPECINEWDFETDTLPETLLDADGEQVYQETILYAKWTKV